MKERKRIFAESSDEWLVSGKHVAPARAPTIDGQTSRVSSYIVKASKG